MTNPVISEYQFKLFAPQANPQYADALNAAAIEFGITTPRQIRHWLAQIAVESGYFRSLIENLNYSLEGLMKTWPKRFPTADSAKPYVRSPVSLANKVYGDRLGNSHPDDGWNYRGRGFIQLTGREAYYNASQALGVDLVNHPDQAADPVIAARTAAWFWKQHRLNEIVAIDHSEKVYLDAVQQAKYNEEDDLRQATEIINGGMLGLDQRRIELLKAAYIWRDV